MEGDIVAAVEPVVAALEALGVSYRIGGSVASSVLGVPRSTLDVDLVCNLRSAQVERFVGVLQADYYADADMVHEAIRRRSSFNLVHLSTMIKIDVFIVKSADWDLEAFSRSVRKRLGTAGNPREFDLTTAEDIVLHKIARITGVLVVLVASACASSQPLAAPAPARAPAPVAPPAPPPAPAPAEAPPAEAAPAEDAGAPAPVEEPKRSQKPLDMLTARDAAFLLDYANSGAKEKAQTACEKEAQDDAEKRGACLTKAREKFLPDVLKFRRDSETQISLLVYKRNASALRELWIGVVELSETSPDTVKVKLTGRQKGTRPLWRGRSEVVISVPNEYSIEFDDPEHGHLRYDAKIGLVSQ